MLAQSVERAFVDRLHSRDVNWGRVWQSGQPKAAGVLIEGVTGTSLDLVRPRLHAG